MKVALLLLTVTLFMCLLDVGCQKGNQSYGSSCLEGVCVHVDVASQGIVGETSPVTVIVESRVEVPELTVYIATELESVDLVGENMWTVHVFPNQPIVRTAALRPKLDGNWAVTGGVLLKDIERVEHSLHLQVTRAGVSAHENVQNSNTSTPSSAATVTHPSQIPFGLITQTVVPSRTPSDPAIVTPSNPSATRVSSPTVSGLITSSPRLASPSTAAPSTPSIAPTPRPPQTATPSLETKTPVITNVPYPSLTYVTSPTWSRSLTLVPRSTPPSPITVSRATVAITPRPPQTPTQPPYP